MSSHFTYEIDERNIRLQLKGNVIEPKEENWQKFETLLSGKLKLRQESNFSNKLNITLSRNVVMPVVFGLIILAFSMLLLNFMNIKNPVKRVVPVSANHVKDISSKEDSDKPSPIKNQTVSENTKKPEIKTERISQESPAEPPTENQNVTDAPKGVMPENTLPKNTSDPPSELLSENQVSSTTTPEQTKKKRKKRLLEPIETEQTSELRPSLISEEKESEERPD